MSSADWAAVGRGTRGRGHGRLGLILWPGIAGTQTAAEMDPRVWQVNPADARRYSISGSDWPAPPTASQGRDMYLVTMMMWSAVVSAERAFTAAL